ncbi:MAG: lutA 2 [Anaerosporomusa subterranea]|jgi:glycolate oxidase iron-sulfur subunit|nr:lutA 2 [Anaerosporomusa subterranea]
MTDTNKQRLQEIHEIASKCDRCGSCLLVCPVYSVNSKEACGARGMVNAARALTKGGIAPESEILESVDYCLLCGACIDVCASKVKVPEVMLKVRQHLAHLSEKPLGLTEAEAKQFEQAFADLCERNAALEKSAVASDRKVAYFFGCQARLGSVDTAVDTLKALHSVADVELVNNECCGLPALTRGHVDEFVEAIKQNIQLYESAETIVSDCACCSDTLKKAASYLSDDPEWNDRAQAFSKKVVSLSEYMAKTGYVPQAQTEKVTYHDPCHLGRLQGVKKAPRDLLKATGNYVEMPGADACCGGPCFFPSDYPEASEALLEKKRANIEKSGAAVVATECYSCLAQLKKAAEKSGGKFKAVHISEVI